MSHALRHEPASYGLTLDAQGWVGIDDLVSGLKVNGGAFGALTPADLHT